MSLRSLKDFFVTLRRIGALVLLSACATPDPSVTADRARDVIARIFDAFNSCDVDALVSQYSDRNLVFFTSGTPEPIKSRTELRQYFSYLTEQACSSPQGLKHTHVASDIRPLGPGVAIVHSTTLMQIVHDGNELEFPFRFTFVLQDEGEGWFVVSQDAQRVPAER